MPNCWTTWRASLRLFTSLLLYGMMTASTLVGPSAWLARVATRLEATPPLRPSTPRSKPTFWTSFWMKRTRIFRTSSGLMASGGKTGSERLAGALMPGPSQFVDGQLHPLVPEQRIGQALAADVTEVQGRHHQRLVGILLLREDVAVGSDGHRATPEVGAILVADAIAIKEEGRKKLRVSTADQVVRFRRPEPLIGRESPAGAGRRTDDHVHALEAQDVRAGEMPDVFTDQHPRAAVGRLEAAEAIARGQVPLLIEHAIGREIHLSVYMHELAPAEVKARVEVAMIRLLDHGAQHDVQVAGHGQQVLHGGAVQPGRAVPNPVPKKVPGQAQFGKDEQFDAGGDRPCHPLAVTGEVAIAIAKGGIHLGQADRELAVGAHASAGVGSRTPPPRASHWAIPGAISSDLPRCTAARGSALRNAAPYVRFAIR